MLTSAALLDPTLLRAGIRIVHFIGLALGLGTATFLDLLLLRFMVWGNISRSHAQAFEFGTRIVTIGLVALWVSGISFLVYYWGFDPEKLGNPKIYAKMTIVGVLSANAIFLHAMVLPIVYRQISRRLFAGLSTRESVYMIIGGATSATSWYVPVALGAVPQLNFIVPAQTIWASYCTILLAANAVTITTFFALKHLVAGTNDPGNLKVVRTISTPLGTPRS